MEKIKISGFSDEIADDLEQQFQYVRELGMDYVCLRTIKGRNIVELSENKIKSEVVPLLRRYNLQVSSIGSGIGKVFIDDKKAVQDQMDKAERLSVFARELGCRYIRIFSFYIPKGKEPKKYKESVIEALGKIVDILKKNEIITLHENEKDIYGDTPERCLELMQELESSFFRGIFDFANFVQIGRDPEEAYQILEKYIEYFHIKDALYKSGKNVLCGQGDGKIETILIKSIKSGFRGFLTLEPHMVNFTGRAFLELNQKIEEKEKNEKKFFGLQYYRLKEILKRIS